MEGLTYKNILITGGTGFVGSHLVEHLVNFVDRIIVPYRTISSYSYFVQKKLHRNVKLVQCNINDYNTLFEIIISNEVDFIVHLAAQAVVDAAYHNPLETIKTNIIGTTNVLEAARKSPYVKGIIIASSDKAYGKSSKTYYEEDPLAGNHPYEVSKSAADLIAQTYFKTYGVPIVVTRFGNIYGEGDFHFNRIIPGIIKALAKNEELVIRSNGKYVREYLYVKDVVLGYLSIMKNFQSVAGETFNFGSDFAKPVLELIALSEGVLNKKLHYTIVNNAKNEIPIQRLSSLKAEMMLKWKIQYDFSHVLPIIFDWYNFYFVNKLGKSSGDGMKYFSPEDKIYHDHDNKGTIFFG